MAVKVGINGFGRIGRLVFRHLWESGKTEVVAVNDITKPATLAHLLKRDSVHGPFHGTVAAEGDNLVIDGRKVRVLAISDPAQLPWRDLGVQVVLESTGRFTKRADCDKHITAGAQKVLVSAPAKGEDLTIVVGVNDHLYDKAKHQVISAASCTTNCLAPVVKVLHDAFGVERGLMTTIHAYTNDQRVLDLPHEDLRRARAANVNIIPTTTGAAVAVTKVLPELEGRLDGMSMRVPVVDGSVVDLVATLQRDVTKDEVNRAVQEAASKPPLRGILEYSEEPLVSSDIIGNLHSSVFDAGSTAVLGKRMVKVVSWYDNELAYAKRAAEIIERMI